MQLTETSNAAYARLAAAESEESPVSDELQSGFRGMEQSFAYSNMEPLYALMREIFAYYPEAEIEALKAGDQAKALEMQYAGAALSARLQADSVLSAVRPRGDAQDALTMTTRRATEADMAGTEVGKDDVVAEGANGLEEPLSPFRGSPRLDDLNSAGVYSAEMDTVAATMAGQESLIAELFRIPGMLAEFPAGRINLNNTAERQRAWGVAFQHYKTAGGGDPLAQLTATIQRYLQAYTFHTGFNVRDAGTSYIDSELPSDLMGRLMRDCGVYALTVAHDLFEVGHAVGAAWRFEIITMVNHATLVLYDPGANTHYVLSNDVFFGPVDGDDPFKTVAEAYSDATDHDHTVFTGVQLGLGDTSMNKRDFERGLWRNYRNSTAWQMDATEAQIAELGEDQAIFAAQENYYKLLDDYDNAMKDAQRIVSTIAALLQSDRAAACLLYTSDAADD